MRKQAPFVPRVASRILRSLRASFITDRPIWMVFGVSTGVMLLFMFLAYRALMFSVLDLGLFNRHMYSLVHFDLSANPLKGFNLLGDHAHIFLILLTPFYAIWPDPRTLLFIQVTAVTASIFPIYYIGRYYLRSRAVSLLWVAAYLAFFGIWAALASPFHDSPVAVLPIAWALYHLLISKKSRALIIWLVILCLVREDMPLVVAMFGVYLALFDKRWKFGLVIIGASLTYMALLIGVVMDRLGPGYSYVRNPFGNSILDIFKTSITRPLEVLKQIFLSPREKFATLVAMLVSFGGLPLLAPQILLLAAPLWLGRTLTVEPWRWSTNMHYTASQAPFLTISAIVGLAWLAMSLRYTFRLTESRLHTGTLVISVLVVVLSIGISIRTHNDQILWLRWRSVQSLSPKIKSAYQAIDMIPPDSSVAIQSQFVPLTSRKNVYNIPFDIENTQPDFVITMDENEVPPFIGIKELYKYRQSLITFGYRVIYWQNGVVLLARPIKS